jgi:hypothetical protein
VQDSERPPGRALDGCRGAHRHGRHDTIRVAPASSRAVAHGVVLHVPRLAGAAARGLESPA